MPTGSGLRHAPARGITDSHRHENQLNRQSGIGAVGLGFLTGADDDDDDEEHEKASFQPVQRTNISQNRLPPGLAPSHTDVVSSNTHRPLLVDTNRANAADHHRAEPRRQQSTPSNAGHFAPLGSHGHVQVAIPNTAQPIPRPPQAAFAQPPPMPQRSKSMSPHPLQAPSSPIVPAFARPSLANRSTEVKFSADSIMRGNSEETLVSKATPKGAEFWRRFSVVVHDEKPHERSSWLSKTQAGSSRMNKCVWLVFLFIIIVIGGVVTLVYFMTHNSPKTEPVSLTGAGSQTAAESTDPVASSASTATSSPLRTVSGGLPPSKASSIPSATDDVLKRHLASYVTLALPTATAAVDPLVVVGHRRRLRRSRH